MGIFEAFGNVKNTVQGKALAVFVSLALVLSFMNVSAFANESESGQASEPVATADEQASDSAAPDAVVAENADAPTPAGAPEIGSAENPVQDETSWGGAFSESEAPNTDPVEGESSDFRIALELQNASIEHLDQRIALPADHIDYPQTKEFKFKAFADEGFNLAAVKAAANGAEVELYPNAEGVYVIEASAIAVGLTIKVEAVAAEAESAPIEDPSATPITSDTTIESEDTAENEGVIEEKVDDEDVVEVVADVSNPAFEGYAQTDGVLVKVTAAEGVLPEGTTVQAARVERQDVVDAVAEKVERQGKKLESALAIDVTLFDKNGNDIQPEGAVNVCFFDANVEGEEIGVYRVSDDASQVEIIGVRQAAAAVQSFDVDHFTIYVVGGYYDGGQQPWNSYEAAPGTVVDLYDDGLNRAGGDWTVSSGGKYANIANADGRSASVEIGKSASDGQTITVTHSKTGWGAYSENFYIVVRAQSFNVYIYTLIPGMSVGITGNPDTIWNGMGVGTITGVSSPSSYAIGTHVSDGDVSNITFPTNFPDIQSGGRAYRYAETGSANADVEGYYTVEWIRTVVSNGANSGNNGYNPGVGGGTKTFHLDGQLKLNEKSKYTVSFKVQEPKSDAFIIQDDYSVRVDSGYAESALRKPSVGSKTVDGKEYTFDGWYKDEACTIPADFKGTIASNTDYYGKYILDEDVLEYDGNGASGGMTAATVGKLNETVAVADNGFVRDGYTFAGWNTAADGSGVSYAAGTGYALTDADDTLYAQWIANEATITVWFYDTFENSKAYVVSEGGVLSQDRSLDKHAKSIDSDSRQWYTAEDIKAFAEEAYGLTPEVDRYESYSILVVRDGKWTEIENLDTYVIQDNDDIRYHVVAEAAHTVAYTAGDHGSGESVSDGPLYRGEEASVKSFADAGFTAAPGYAFDHWELVSTGQTYDPDDSYTMGSSDVEFEAVYVADATQTYAVEYKAENGIVDTDSNTGIQVLGTEGVTGSTATANLGYRFEGWYVDDVKIAGAEANLTAETAAGSIKRNADGTYAATTFTARFVPDFDLSATGFDVVYDGNAHYVTVNGTILPSDIVEYWVDDEKLDSNAFVNVVESATVTVKVVRDGEVWTGSVDAIITPRVVTLVGESADRAYNETVQEITGITSDGLLRTHRFEGLTYSASGKDVGSYGGAFAGDTVIVTADGDDVTGNYATALKPGNLTIYTNATDLGLAAESGGGVYNASPYRLENVAATGGAARGA